MKSIAFVFVFLFLGTCFTFSQDEATASPDKTVTRLYELVTFEAGTTPDWDKVRALFIEEAIIVLRTSWDSTAVFTVEGFIGDFVAFAENPNIKAAGFKEEILKMKTLEFGEMANILVLYQASVQGSERPPQKGVDNFSLIRKDDRWWIISVTNEVPTDSRPLPEIL
jgi:hypothetical protein